MATKKPTQKPRTATGGIRERRRALGMRLVDLAIAAGISTTYLELLENGYTPKRGEGLPRVLAALDRAEAKAA